MKLSHCEWPGSYFLQDSQIHTYSCIGIVFFLHLGIFFGQCQVTKTCLPRTVPWRNQVWVCGHAIPTWLSCKILKKSGQPDHGYAFFVGNTFASTLSKQPVTITLTRFLSWQKTSPQKTISTTNISPSCSFVDGFLKKNAHFLWVFKENISWFNSGKGVVVDENMAILKPQILGDQIVVWRTSNLWVTSGRVVWLTTVTVDILLKEG